MWNTRRGQVVASLVLWWVADPHTLSAQDPARPFPQHTVYAAQSVKPTDVSQAEMDLVTASAYDRWKRKHLVRGCTAGEFYVACGGAGATGNRHAISTSESQGYGMLMTAFMAGHDPEAKMIFDGLHRFYRSHPSKNNPRLMAWSQIKGCGNAPKGDDSAADGDLDIAYALLLADRQWGSAGEINYAADAKALLEAILADDVNRATHTIKFGDEIASDDPSMTDTRSSDLMAEHFRTFHRITGEAEWAAIAEKSYALIGSMQSTNSAQTGLMPDFMHRVDHSPSPARPHFIEGTHDGAYYYNACRWPFRLALDYLVAGEPRAQSSLAKINSWIREQAHDDPKRIAAGYTLSGRPIDPDDHPMCFVAPFAVAAMTDRENQEWLNRAWKAVAAADRKQGYYDGTVRLLCLIVLSGNWWSP